MSIDIYEAVNEKVSKTIILYDDTSIPYILSGHSTALIMLSLNTKFMETCHINSGPNMRGNQISGL